jgi:serine phosphatase RsbU (regulator of sigma subunit)
MVTKKSYAVQNSVNGFKPNHRSMLHLDGLWQLLQQETQPLSLNHLLARIQADNNIQEDDQTILSLEVF